MRRRDRKAIQAALNAAHSTKERQTIWEAFCQAHPETTPERLAWLAMSWRGKLQVLLWARALKQSEPSSKPAHRQ